MKFDRVSIRHVGPFKLVDLDLASLPGRLTAVCGPNGAGKTTLLELLAAGLYREAPTRGSLASLATARDASVEVTVTNGATHTVRQLVDAISGKGETLVLDAAGAPVLDSAKVSAADRWVAQHLPSPTALYSSSFAVQGQRGFLDLGKSERKTLLAQLLDLQRYERMAAAARENAGAAKAELYAISARLVDLPEADLAALRGAVENAQSCVELFRDAMVRARRSLDRARAMSTDAERAREIADQRRAASERQAAAAKQIADVEARIERNRGLLARGDEIRTAVKRAAELEVEKAAANEALATARTKLAEARAAEAAARAALSTARTSAAAAEQRVKRAQARLGEREAVLAAVEKLEALRLREGELQTIQQSARAKSDEWSTVLLTGKDARIKILRTGLEDVLHGVSDVPVATVLDLDDKQARRGLDAPERLREAKAVEANANLALRDIAAVIAATERLAARLPEMESALVDTEAAVLEQAAALSAVADCRLRLEEQARVNLDRASAALSECEVLVHKAQVELDDLVPSLSLARPLEQAEARVEELSAQLDPLRATLAAAERELAALPAAVAGAFPDVAAHENALALAELEHDARQAALTRAQDAVTAGEATQARRVALLGEQRAVEQRLADWTRLAQDLGKDGLPALELDAALPEINAIANSLLHRCLGTRFTVELRTTRLSADGKREIEDLEVRVIDTQNGRDADASTYSGGELVLVGTAISLALTTLACRRAGSANPTLVYDEAGAALDAENARAWIAMLRLAADEIGADRCLFVSHSEEVQSLADSRIVIRDGVVSVEQ